MKIDKREIGYVEFLCNMLPKILKDINNEYDKEEYIYSSPSRARFNRLRIEMNKTLIKLMI